MDRCTECGAREVEGFQHDYCPECDIPCSSCPHGQECSCHCDECWDLAEATEDDDAPEYMDDDDDPDDDYDGYGNRRGWDPDDDDDDL